MIFENIVSVEIDAAIPEHPWRIFTCSKSTIDTSEKGVRYVQS